MKELRVACYPCIPEADDPMRLRLQAQAAAEGKKLVLILFNPDYVEGVFGRSFILLDEGVEAR